MWCIIIDPTSGHVLGAHGLRIGKPPETHWVNHPRVAMKFFVGDEDGKRMAQIRALAKSVGGRLFHIVGPPWRPNAEQLALPLDVTEGHE